MFSPLTFWFSTNLIQILTRLLTYRLLSPSDHHLIVRIFQPRSKKSYGHAHTWQVRTTSYPRNESRISIPLSSRGLSFLMSRQNQRPIQEIFQRNQRLEATSVFPKKKTEKPLKRHVTNPPTGFGLASSPDTSPLNSTLFHSHSVR